MPNRWEADIASLLSDILGVQDELLALLAKKRELLVQSDTAGLDALGPEEQRLMQSLTACVQRRQELLGRAEQEGLPAASLQELSKALPRDEHQRLYPRVSQAKSNARLLRHQSLANWMVVQRTLIHLSQLLEIIATGGRLQPTYGEGETSTSSGSLVDRAA
jgi:flagellar biosynthesis/type III secretory pathway chaperone